MVERTLGESRLGIDYNTSNDDYMFRVKQKAAELIDLIDQAAHNPNLTEVQVDEYYSLKERALKTAEEVAGIAIEMATL